jgi:hypothetical protein
MPTTAPRKAARATPAKAAPPTLKPRLAKQPVREAAKPSVSRHGKPLGRPRIERGPLAQVQTRVPAPLSDYLKMLALEKLPDQPAPFRTMQRMFETLFAQFIDEQPWRRGFAWRESQAVARFSGGEMVERTSWKQLNVQLPIALAQRIETTATQLDRSQSSFCYTALCWWAGALYPPVAAGR